MAGRLLRCFLPLYALAHSQLCLHCEEQFEFSLLQHSSSPFRAPPAEPFWSSRGGGPATRSSVDYPAADISKAPSWVWPNEFHEQVRHSPLIDADLNVYVATTTRLRKFDSNGKLLWTWGLTPFEEAVSAAPALYQGAVYIIAGRASGGPALTSLDAKTGGVKWQRVFDGMRHNGDAEALSVYNGTVFFGVGRRTPGGTDTVVAASASDGKYLWEYQTEEVMWNFSPSTPGDGSLIFSSSCGAVFRLSADGKLLWRAGRGADPPRSMCVPAGGALGPNGVFYAESSRRQGSNHDEDGTLAAYDIADGALLWERDLPLRAAQYPAVGRLGKNGPLAVVAALGDNPTLPKPSSVDAATVAALGPWRNSILAVDATTGDTLWQYDAPPYYSSIAAGELNVHNETDGWACWPDSQGIPLITGDGTVYASSSLGGELRQLRDADGDGLLSPSEVAVFETHNCFLNSPSAAPGMLVAAPCWGPMYVFRES